MMSTARISVVNPFWTVIGQNSERVRRQSPYNRSTARFMRGRLIVITVGLFRVDRTQSCGRTGKSLQ
jgi:hypothetical protein